MNSTQGFTKKRTEADMFGNVVTVKESTVKISTKREHGNPCQKVWGKTEGEQCRDCIFLHRVQHGGGKFSKCEKRGITHSQATDHNMSFQACGLFQPNGGPYKTNQTP